MVFKKKYSIFKSSLLLSCLVFILSYPNIYYFSVKVFYENISEKAGYNDLNVFFLKQIIIFLFLLFLCAFCGFAFHKRNQMIGLGSFYDIRKNALKIYLPLSILIWLLSYVLFDRYFSQVAPEYYPTNIIWALTIPFRSAFLEELVFRFGMLTVIVGGVRRWLDPQWANGLVSVFYAFVMTKKSFEQVHLSLDFNLLSLFAMLGAFLTCLFLGYLYIKKGLMSAMFFHFLLSFKFVFYALVF